MSEILRKLRGMLGVAATWGAAWGAIFAIIGLVVWVLDPDSIGPGDDPLLIVRIGATYGLITGASFGVLLALAERNRSIVDLSLARVGVWGALAASVFPLVSPANNAMLIFLCPIGAALAAGSIALARRAERAALPSGAADLPERTLSAP